MSDRAARVFGSLATFFLLFSATSSTFAYTVQTPIAPGCHERITTDALRFTRNALATAKPLPVTTDDQKALLADLPFDLPSDVADMGGATLLLGVRDNDLKGIPVSDLDQIVEITADDSTQHEHCLRMSTEVEPGGTKSAVDDCRSFILTTLTSALDGLDGSGNPDPTLTQSVLLDLAIRGQINFDLPIFYFRMGQAIHAIEDSFAHDWRSTADPHKITVSLNWVDYSENKIDESVTGPAHENEMDRCDDPDALRAQRRGLATEAATVALMVALDPTQSRDQKISGFQNMLDTYVVFDTAESCTSANGWCNAPERSYAPSSCGCDLAHSRNGSFSSLFAIAALGFMFALRRRRFCARASHRTIVFVAASIFVSNFFAASLARADDSDAGAASPPPSTPGGEAVPGVTPVAKEQPTPETSSGSGPVAALAGKSSSGTRGVEDHAGAMFAEIAFAGSYDKSALMGRIGGRLALSKRWMLGLDAEWNPYLSVGETHVRSGAIDVYASLIARFQLAYEPINLRSSVSLGGSVLLFDLVGAPAGSIGPYFGVSVLGLEIKLGRGFYLTVDPDSIAIPIPHVTGIPFVYYQYRFQIGLELGG
jgi:hypothetical protein